MVPGLRFCLTQPVRSHWVNWSSDQLGVSATVTSRSCSLTPPSPSNVPPSKFIFHMRTFRPAQGTKRVYIFIYIYIRMVLWVRGDENQLLRSSDSSGVYDNHGSLYLSGHVCTLWSVRTSRRVPSAESFSHMSNNPQKYFVFSLLFVFLNSMLEGKTFPLSPPDVGSAADHTVEHWSSVETVLREQKGNVWAVLELGW